MTEIGNPEKEYIVEPLEDPVPRRVGPTPDVTPIEPVELPDAEPVPA